MNILALDLGTKTGFAYNDGDDLQIGTITLATPKELAEAKKNRMDRRQDIRVMRLHEKLQLLMLAFPFKFVVFEDVEFSSFTKQTQLWASLRAAVWTAVGHDAAMECVNVTRLKKLTTGSGSADKKAMAAWLVMNNTDRLAWKGYTVVDKKTGKELDDNALDALAVWLWAQQTLSRAV